MTIIGKQGLPAEGPEGAHRLREGEQGQGHLRQRRRRRGLAPVRHALHDARSRPTSTTVPYKGTGPAMNDLVGGQVDFMCDQTTNTTPQIKGGKVKAYGGDDQAARDHRCPKCRRWTSQGLQGFEVDRIWHGALGAAWHAQADHRQARQRAAGRAEGSGVMQRSSTELGTEPVPADSAATPAALRGAPEGRDRQVGADHQEGRRLRRLKMPPPLGEGQTALGGETPALAGVFIIAASVPIRARWHQSLTPDASPGCAMRASPWCAAAPKRSRPAA